MKKAFTLAEVLITLGVIGIVAAMTLPQLIKNYQAKVLETAFKKSYSNISKAYLMTKNELGISNLRQEFATYDEENKIYPLAGYFRNTFIKQLGGAKKIRSYNYANYNNSKQNVSIDTELCGTACPHALNILPDGSSVGVFINSATIYLDIDTNGPLKKPNRYGHDIFTFAIYDKSDQIKPIKQSKLYTEEELENATWPDSAGSPCSYKSKQKGNGFGCSYYAINDINPDDSTKSYWKNLPK